MCKGVQGCARAWKGVEGLGVEGRGRAWTGLYEGRHREDEEEIVCKVDMVEVNVGAKWPVDKH